LEQQTIRPVIIIVDTHSTAKSFDQLQQSFGANDWIRLIALAPYASPHLSSPVAKALDLAQAAVESAFTFFTHDDVILKNPTILKDFMTQMWEHDTDVVGYRMSPRDHVTNEWKYMISHTCTLVATQAIREANARWSLEDCIADSRTTNPQPGWPDTETGWNRALTDHAIRPYFIGAETNDPHFEDERLIHRRSLTSHRIHWPELAAKDADWQKQIIQQTHLVPQ
jgi:hypothetical protein